jgi:phosphoribosylaminoimidazole-succinocarboxamide synthase
VGRGLLTAEQWSTLSAYALALFARGQAIAAERGLILVDTKYEFGTDADDRIVLADEIHTPDSSRYWFAGTYPERLEAGERPDSFDKDFVRAWVAARCDPYRDEIPAIPPDMILKTAEVYVDAFERITGRAFEMPPGDEPVAERVRRNLAAYLREPAAG